MIYAAKRARRILEVIEGEGLQLASSHATAASGAPSAGAADPARHAGRSRTAAHVSRECAQRRSSPAPVEPPIAYTDFSTVST
ncbi:hypothetical protein PJK52_29085, partial [Mycobacterium kansasii]